MKRTLIVGAGQACNTILTEILNAKNSPYENDKVSAAYDPVCIVDDNRELIGREIHGVRVVGMTYEIPSIVAEYHIEQILFAIPSCEEESRKRILGICSSSNVPVKVIPFIGNLIFDEGRTKLVHQARDIKIEDLLGREPVRFDNDEIRSCIRGKKCMVTGGGGSIGSELVRQIAKYSPEQIIIIDI